MTHCFSYRPILFTYILYVKVKTSSEQVPLTGLCKHGNELLCSTRKGNLWPAMRLSVFLENMYSVVSHGFIRERRLCIVVAHKSSALFVGSPITGITHPHPLCSTPQSASSNKKHYPCFSQSPLTKSTGKHLCLSMRGPRFPPWWKPAHSASVFIATDSEVQASTLLRNAAEFLPVDMAPHLTFSTYKPEIFRNLFYLACLVMLLVQNLVFIWRSNMSACRNISTMKYIKRTSKEIVGRISFRP